jgi:predicted nucleic acid-binding Zn ribbon protein
MLPWSYGEKVVCPICGSDTEKVLGIPSIIYRGSGFYTTDSRNAQSPPKKKGNIK